LFSWLACLFDSLPLASITLPLKFYRYKALSIIISPHPHGLLANHSLAFAEIQLSTHLQMSINSGLREAPPTRNPSTSFSRDNSLQFLPFTLPPYMILSFSLTDPPTRLAIQDRSSAWTSCALWRSSQPSAYSPDWLVRENDVAPILLFDHCRNSFQLPLVDLHRLIRFPLLQCLSDA